MAGRRQRRLPDDDAIPSELRGQTHFTKADKEKFNKAIEGLNAAAIYVAMTRYEREYRNTASNAEMSGGFQPDQLDAVPGAYRLIEIRAGADYRVAVMFLHGEARAYWVHPWKKPRGIDRQSVNLAKLRAREHWDRLQRQREEERKRGR